MVVERFAVPHEFDDRIDSDAVERTGGIQLRKIFSDNLFGRRRRHEAEMDDFLLARRHTSGKCVVRKEKDGERQQKILMKVLHAELFIPSVFYCFLHPLPIGSDSGQMKRIPVLTIHNMTERLSPCRYTIYNIDRMMSSAIGFALLRRQSVRIYEIHFSIMAAVWPPRHIIFFRIQTMLGLHFHFVCARFSNCSTLPSSLVKKTKILLDNLFAESNK